MLRLTVLIALCLGLTACAGHRTGLRDFSTNGDGPDEFSVLPTRPLEMPANLTVLPPPAPGTANRVDRNPVGEGIAALGGSAAATLPGQVPGRDAGLVAAVSTGGVSPDIRATLASEDAAYRSRTGRFGAGFFGGDRYFRAYAGQALDARAEADRFLNAGIPVPTAPPAAD